jgi:hypothetical protein
VKNISLLLLRIGSGILTYCLELSNNGETISLRVSGLRNLELAANLNLVPYFNHFSVLESLTRIIPLKWHENAIKDNGQLSLSR